MSSVSLQRVRVLFLAALPLFATGCTMVQSTQPFFDPHRSPADLRLLGTWDLENHDARYHIVPRADDDSTLSIALHSGSGMAIHYDPDVVFTTKLGGSFMAMLRNADGDYDLVQYQFDADSPDSFTIRPLDREVVAQAVQAGELKKVVYPGPQPLELSEEDAQKLPPDLGSTDLTSPEQLVEKYGISAEGAQKVSSYYAESVAAGFGAVNPVIMLDDTTQRITEWLQRNAATCFETDPKETLRFRRVRE